MPVSNLITPSKSGMRERILFVEPRDSCPLSRREQQLVDAGRATNINSPDRAGD